jgi:hypothetical protein
MAEPSATPSMKKSKKSDASAVAPTASPKK